MLAASSLLSSYSRAITIQRMGLLNDLQIFGQYQQAIYLPSEFRAKSYNSFRITFCLVSIDLGFHHKANDHFLPFLYNYIRPKCFYTESKLSMRNNLYFNKAVDTKIVIANTFLSHRDLPRTVE